MTLLVEVPIESPYSDASNSNVNDMEICAFGYCKQQVSRNAYDIAMEDSDLRLVPVNIAFAYTFLLVMTRSLVLRVHPVKLAIL